MKLQRDIQREISRLKRRSSASDEIDELRAIRFHARHLGDALAWTMFSHNRKNIVPLGRNSPVPIPTEESAGDQGTNALIAELMRGGWGFALLHDITNWLRIGDATFISPRRSEHPYRTVEFKASVSSRNPDGTTTFSVTVLEAWHESLGERDDPKWHPHYPKDAATRTDAQENLVLPAARREDRRLERQSQRMTLALQTMLAKDYEVTQLPDKTHLVSGHAVLGANYWPQVKKVIREARRTGYADIVVDDAVLYAAIYDPNLIGAHSLTNTNLTSTLRFSGIGKGQCIGPPSLVLNALPPSHTHEVSVNTPFYLLDAPKNWIKDMLYGRLAVVSVHNPGRFAFEAAKNGDYDIHFVAAPGGGPGDYHLDLRTEIHGEQATISIPGIQRYIQEVVVDFRGVDDFVAHLSGLLRAASEVPGLMESQQGGGRVRGGRASDPPTVSNARLGR